MTDDELIKWLREGVYPDVQLAADRIEKLKEDLKSQIEHTDDLIRSAEPMMALALGAAENAAEAAEAKLAKAVEALQYYAFEDVYGVGPACQVLKKLEKTE